MRENNLKKLWQEDRVALNAWLTIPSAWTVEIMAHTGFDALTIDMQHGLMGYQTALTMLQAMSSTSAVPLVRVPWNDPASIMRLLDAGAYGIVCPMINNRQEAENFVQACRYPPLGQRSYGPIRANVYAGNDYFAAANQTVLTFAMIETRQALENLEAIVSTPGLDGLYVGTVDLSISLGLPEKVDITSATVEAALKKIVKTAKEHGLITGIHVNSPNSTQLLTEWGFQLLTLANDTPLLRGAANSVLEQTQQKLGYSQQ
ncbi:MAG: aldolase/citrate lyase family protein [Cyanobacteria bacterium P01_F01_bin.86]